MGYGLQPPTVNCFASALCVVGAIITSFPSRSVPRPNADFAPCADPTPRAHSAPLADCAPLLTPPTVLTPSPVLRVRTRLCGCVFLSVRRKRVPQGDSFKVSKPCRLDMAFLHVCSLHISQSQKCYTQYCTNTGKRCIVYWSMHSLNTSFDMAGGAYDVGGGAL